MTVEDIIKIDHREISRRGLKDIHLLKTWTSAAISWVRQKVCWTDLVIQGWHHCKHAQRGLKTQFPICAEAENNLGRGEKKQVRSLDPGSDTRDNEDAEYLLFHLSLLTSSRKFTVRAARAHNSVPHEEKFHLQTFVSSVHSQGNHNSSVGKGTRLRDRQPRNRGFILGIGGTLSMEVKRVDCEADHSLPSGAKVKIPWSYTSPTSYPFKALGLIKHKDNFICIQYT
jgi:hypothetical protein